MPVQLIKSQKLTEYLKRCSETEGGFHICPDGENPFDIFTSAISLGEEAAAAGKNIFYGWDGDDVNVFLIAATEDEACEEVASWESYEAPDAAPAAPLSFGKTKDPFMDALEALTAGK